MHGPMCADCDNAPGIAIDWHRPFRVHVDPPQAGAVVNAIADRVRREIYPFVFTSSTISKS